MRIDINSDMGESFGSFRVGNDQELMNYITSANVACGFHAGDPVTLHKTIQFAKENGVSVGAHPGFYDVRGFGRYEIKVKPQEIYYDVLYQLGAIKAFTDLHQVPLQHVKPHGALYNMAHKDLELSRAIVQAIYDFDQNLIVFGIDGGQLLNAAKEKGLKIAREFFIDRTYQEDGSLTPRTTNNAYVHDPNETANRVVRLITEKRVQATNGSWIPMDAETLCVHGDGEHALSLAEAVRDRLIAEGINLIPVGRKK
ncbi:5-oxoprolinase subunit PxpA [Tepidibacillus marianensis]|uniref:LamB/YcsF family protein n=1 Tax=Tepidibacillus marianensis TaxID=3131995 RepID=UPI0030CFE49B